MTTRFAEPMEPLSKKAGAAAGATINQSIGRSFRLKVPRPGRPAEPGTNAVKGTNMSKLVSVALAAAAALAAVSTSTQLFAAEPAVVYKTTTVSYRDLNLASAEGAKELHNRVRAAVGEVCGIASGPDLAERRSIRTCRSAALESARPQMDRVISGYRPQVIVTASR
jgi:UrcA family protein